MLATGCAGALAHEPGCTFFVTALVGLVNGPGRAVQARLRWRLRFGSATINVGHCCLAPDFQYRCGSYVRQFSTRMRGRGLVSCVTTLPATMLPYVACGRASISRR